MYRALTYLAQARRVAVTDEPVLIHLARSATIDILPNGPPDGRAYTVLADGEDVTWNIRTPAVDADVSAVSAVPDVRHEMVTAQRRVASRGRCVLAGRDIGTVVLPDADLKIFLTATPEERARRRADELRQRGEQVDVRSLSTALAGRDRLDSERAASPLKPADDAIILDSTGVPADEMVARIVALARERKTR